MPTPFLLNLAALTALIPAVLWSTKRAAPRRDTPFWAVLTVATAGPATIGAAQLSGPWESGLSEALWVSITVSMLYFVLLALFLREAWRLLPLLAPYLFLLGLLATLWSQAGPGETLARDPDTWLALHIVVSVSTYALCTLAAVAGAAVLLQERAIKRKQPGNLTHRLPSVADASRLQGYLLGASAIVLALGIVTGMAEKVLTSGQVLGFDHKTLLSFLAFAVIAVLFVIHRRSGLRGQNAARMILVVYLLLTLAYPGVKFVTEILLT